MHLLNPKTKSEIKLIVFELFSIENLKGKTQRELSDRIAELRKCNVLSAVVTSHTEAVLKSITNIFDTDLKIYCNGALVKLGDTIIYRATIPLDIANEIISVLISCTDLIDLTVDTISNFYSIRPSTIYEQKHGYSNTIVTNFTKPLQDENILRITPD